MDAYGYIYKLEADSANRLYAAVLKTGKDTDAYNETTYSLQFLNSAGETVVANVDDDYEMITLHGSWARERQIDVRGIGYGKQSVASNRGESSHQEHPFMAVKQKTATNNSGEVYGAASFIQETL